ncbi:MAG: hypothetical protein QW587_11890 [Candidatus Bathyarchaeia archaeon]
MENPPRWPRTVHRKATCRLVGRVYALRESGIDSLMAVYHILKMDGLSNPPDRPRRRSYTRWVRERPNELWQTDWKLASGGLLVDSLPRRLLQARDSYTLPLGRLV